MQRWHLPDDNNVIVLEMATGIWQNYLWMFCNSKSAKHSRIKMHRAQTLCRAIQTLPPTNPIDKIVVGFRQEQIPLSAFADGPSIKSPLPKNLIILLPEFDNYAVHSDFRCTKCIMRSIGMHASITYAIEEQIESETNTQQ